MSLSPGPSPGISGVSDGFLHLVSDWLVPGAASTRPWSSHLWRKEKPNSGGHTAGRGKWQGGPYRVEHWGGVVSSWGFWVGGRNTATLTWCGAGSGRWGRRCSGSALFYRAHRCYQPLQLHLARKARPARMSGQKEPLAQLCASFTPTGWPLFVHPAHSASSTFPHLPLAQFPQG